MKWTITKELHFIFQLCKYEAQIDILTTENIDLSKQLSTISYQNQLMEEGVSVNVILGYIRCLYIYTSLK